jgi:sigma-E factor negative regulatory protein RseA
MGSIMGSVSMQSQACSRGERLSAFVDGESLGEIGHGSSIFSEWSSEDRVAWSHYHLIGDTLRSDELAVNPAASSAFLAGFAERLEAEPHVLAPAALPVRQRAQGLRRRVVPAFAVAAAAAMLTWIVVPQIQHAGGNLGGTQVASAGAPTGGVQSVAAAHTAQEPNIIRDASLDEYLEAHQQFAQQPVVSGSMPLIRAAVLTSQGQ